MAPVPETSPLSSVASYISDIISRSTSRLSKRDNAFVAGSGTVSPASVPNNAIFAIFGVIGAGFVITGIWFFFWAKNGGIHFKEDDWDEYKSTVLRRKGPNGTTLSGATESTDLGGGSIVGKKGRKGRRYKDIESSNGDLESSIGTASEMSELKSEAYPKKKKKGTRFSRLRGEPKDDDDQTVMSDDRPDEVVRAYRHEKPARVGGLNKQSEGSAFEGSTAAGSTTDSHSDLLSHRQPTPTSTPKKIRKDNYTGGTGSPGIRQVQPSGNQSAAFRNSTSKSKKAETEKSEREQKIKAEARKLQEKGRAATASSGRRDFSYTAGDDDLQSEISRQERRERRASRSPTKNTSVPGGYVESDMGSDITGTKSYHHPIPGLSSTSTKDYADERRKARASAGAYRRGRGDEESGY